jgi:phospholipid/cholesterol/gamma-HCH transport system substrate-binding protein
MSANDERSVNLRVGGFLLVGLLLACGMVVYFGRLGDGLKSYYSLRVEYPNASGLLRGAEVLMSGAKIGKVSSGPHILPDMRGVYIEIKILESARIPANSIFTIGSSGLLGDRFVDISLPADSSVETSTFLQPGDVVQGKRETGLGEVMQEGGDLVAEVREAVSKINGVVTRLDQELFTPATLKNIESSVSNLRTTTEQLSLSAGKFDGLLSETSGKVQELMSDAGNILNKASGAVDQTSTLLSSVNRTATSFENTATDIRRIVADTRKGKGTLGMLLTDDSFAENLRDLADNMRRHGVLWYRDSAGRIREAPPPRGR